MKRDSRGFTLVELVVVMTILGVLAAILVPTYLGYIAHAKTAADETTVGYLNEATRVYYAGKPSPNLFEVEGTSNDVLLQALVDDGYFSEKPVTTQNDTSFVWNYGNRIWQISDALMSGYYSLLVSDITLGAGGFTGYITGSYSGASKDVMIPKVLGGTTMTNIGQDVFAKKGLTSLGFPADSQITRIHARAFNGNSLTEVSFPSSLKRLDFGAFWNNNITKVTIGSNVYLEGQVFRNNDAFRDAYYANGAGTYVYKNGVWIKQ